MNPQRIAVDVVTAADGTATFYSPAVKGALSAIHYIKDSFANGVDFTITNETTGQGLWAESDVNAAAVRAPRQPTHTQAGVAALFAAGGVAVQDVIVLADDRIKIAIAQGGDTKHGTFIFVLT